MPAYIHLVQLGLCNCYLVRDKGIILVDAGMQSLQPKFVQRLEALSIDPQDISLIFLTHGHWDHIGGLVEIKTLTDCKVAINQHEKPIVEQGLKPFPPPVNPWGSLLEILIKIRYKSSLNFSGAPVDLALEDGKYPLESYGIQGKILHTPGHSSGSMSLLLDSGEAFVGDLAVNGPPMRIGPNMSVFAEDPAAVKRSWQMLLDNGAKWIYPAHGKPFEADALGKLMKR